MRAVMCNFLPAYTSQPNFIDKINFTPGNAHKIDALHERVAGRLKWVIDVNQGLYLKLGQALGKLITHRLNPPLLL